MLGETFLAEQHRPHLHHSNLQVCEDVPTKACNTVNEQVCETVYEDICQVNIKDCYHYPHNRNHCYYDPTFIFIVIHRRLDHRTDPVMALRHLPVKEFRNKNAEMFLVKNATMSRRRSVLCCVLLCAMQCTCRQQCHFQCHMQQCRTEPRQQCRNVPSEVCDNFPREVPR